MEDLKRIDINLENLRKKHYNYLNHSYEEQDVSDKLAQLYNENKLLYEILFSLKTDIKNRDILNKKQINEMISEQLIIMGHGTNKLKNHNHKIEHVENELEKANNTIKQKIINGFNLANVFKVTVGVAGTILFVSVIDKYFPRTFEVIYKFASFLGKLFT